LDEWEDLVMTPTGDGDNEDEAIENLTYSLNHYLSVLEKAYSGIKDYEPMKTKIWFDKVVKPRLKKNDSGEYVFPDPLEDLKYFSKLHSWYKHLDPPCKFYPILRIGREKRNAMCDDEDDQELHWAFVEENDDLTSKLANTL